MASLSTDPLVAPGKLYPPIQGEYPEIAVAVALKTFIVADFSIDEAILRQLKRQVDGRVVSLTQLDFCHQSVGDVEKLNPRSRVFFLHVRSAQAWIAQNMRDLQKHQILAVTERSSQQPWLRQIQPTMVLKRSDLDTIESLVDKVTGELIPFVHISSPPGCILRFLQVLWRLVSKGDSPRS